MFKSRLTNITLTLTIILFSTILILLVPKKHEVGLNTVIPNYINLNKYMNFIIDVDSDHLLNLANNPKNIFRVDEHRQTRPLLILSAHIISKPIDLLLRILEFDKDININFDGKIKL